MSHADWDNSSLSNMEFDEVTAHKIYAASDFFMMPSQYEPCGLGQLISLKYGTLPIVRIVEMASHLASIVQMIFLELCKEQKKYTAMKNYTNNYNKMLCNVIFPGKNLPIFI